MSSQNRVFCIFLIYFFYLSGPLKATAKTQLWFKFLVVYGGKALKFYIVDSVSTLALRGPISCKIFTSANCNFYFHNFFSTSATFFFYTFNVFHFRHLFCTSNVFCTSKLFSLLPTFYFAFSLVCFQLFFKLPIFFYFKLFPPLPTFIFTSNFFLTSNFLFYFKLFFTSNFFLTSSFLNALVFTSVLLPTTFVF